VDEEDLPSLMREMEAFIEETTDYRVQLVNKPMDEAIELDDISADPWADTTKYPKEGAHIKPPLGRGLRCLHRTWKETTDELYNLYTASCKLKKAIAPLEKKDKKKPLEGDERKELIRLCSELKETNASIIDIMEESTAISIKDGRLFYLDGRVAGAKVLRVENLDVMGHNKWPASQSYAYLTFRDSRGWHFTKSQFLFGNASDDIFNTFIGLTIERHHDIMDYDHDPSKIESWLKATMVMCQNDPEIHELFLDWLADIPQNPGRRPTFGWFFMGRYGSGKTSPMESLGRALFGIADPTADGGHGVYGDMYASFPNIDEVQRKFNAAACGKLLILFDDMSPDNKMKTDEGGFNNLMSRVFTNKEHKGRDVQVVPEYARFVGATNFEEAIRLRYGQRRLMVCQTADDLVGDDEFWVKFRREVEHSEFASNLYKFLMSRDIRGFNRNPTRMPIITDIMKRRMMVSCPVYVRYLIDRFLLVGTHQPDLQFCIDINCHSDCCIHAKGPFSLSMEERTMIPRQIIQKDFVAWMSRQAGRIGFVPHTFTKEMVAMGIIDQGDPRNPPRITVRRPGGGSEYGIHSFDFCSVNEMRGIMVARGYLDDETGQPQDGEGGDESSALSGGGAS
jgi:hypothetical protein